MKNLGTITNGSDVTHKKYVDNQGAIIPYAEVDSTSQSHLYTASVEGVYELVDGMSVMLRNNVITSHENGFYIDINNLGAKPVYSNLESNQLETTKFNINYTLMFVYDSTRVQDGCWVCYNGYDSDTQPPDIPELIDTYNASKEELILTWE